MADETTKTEDVGLIRDAFMKHVEGVLDPAYRMATVILLDYAAAEDAVQGATLTAWRRFQGQGGEVTSFRTWFLAVVAAHCRRLRRWRRLTLRGGDVGGPRDIVGGLPLPARVALFCRVALELPDDEVARVLGTSPVRVRNRVYRARERVEAELQRREEEEDEE
jgi:DNA-directed RNA polymerase specialized sigma24 family protein